MPHDHDEITNESGVIRRISDHYLTPGPDGKRQISTMALQKSSGANGGMSVDLEQSILAAGDDVVTHVTSPQFLGSVKFVTGDLRQEELLVGYDPLPDNIHHGEVWGNLSKGKQRRLLKKAEWCVEIPNAIITAG
ncbi:hypothetical protein [Lichenibacterium minor]|uniref:hypothetical protein n=1 Tax=Lichenibacterium minor TaxID=2316528 RepID=UPI001A932F6E|nr:hypothetical protein [Lichenibacterium minor]